MKTTTVIKNLKEGGYVLIDNVPCRVEKVTISSSGKHGAAKARVDAIGLFDGRRRSIVKPADEIVEVPVLEKKRGQVLSILSGNKAQIMDLNDFSVFELDIPEEKKDKIKQGEEVDYFEVIGIKTLKELK
ncbi:MAG: translation initiation factor IF-5A [Candidatus Aenigmatarchaeota archaeon]